MSDTTGSEADLAASTDLAAKDAVIEALKEQNAGLNRIIQGHASADAAIRAELDAARQKIAALEAAALAAAGADTAPVPPGTPNEIKLTAPHGFIDDGGVNRYWPAGTRITKPSEVALLVARGAAHEVTKPA